MLFFVFCVLFERARFSLVVKFIKFIKVRLLASVYSVYSVFNIFNIFNSATVVRLSVYSTSVHTSVHTVNTEIQYVHYVH